MRDLDYSDVLMDAERMGEELSARDLRREYDAQHDWQEGMWLEREPEDNR